MIDISHAGTRTRVGRVRADYPSQLDYMGLKQYIQSYL